MRVADGAPLQRPELDGADVTKVIAERVAAVGSA
jgi:hypothetical protein